MEHDGWTYLSKIGSALESSKRYYSFDGKLQPIKLLFQSLKSAISLATTKVSDGLWAESSVKSYIPSFFINTSRYNHLVNRCNNVNNLKFIRGDGSTNNILKEMLLSDSKLQSENTMNGGGLLEVYVELRHIL